MSFNLSSFRDGFLKVLFKDLLKHVRVFLARIVHALAITSYRVH